MYFEVFGVFFPNIITEIFLLKTFQCDHQCVPPPLNGNLRCPTCQGRNMTPVEHYCAGGLRVGAALRLLAVCCIQPQKATFATVGPVVSPYPLYLSPELP